MFYTYILYSKKLNKFYTGYCEDLKARLKEHNSGYSPFTSKGVSWKIAHYQSFVYKEDAIREEKFLKTGKGRERRKYLLKTFIEKNIRLRRISLGLEK